jgi:hypothetical protein
VPTTEFADPESLATHVRMWFEENAAKPRADCDVRYFDVGATTSAGVAAIGELLTRKAVRRLVDSAARKFPELDRVELGERIEGAAGGLSFDWLTLPDARVPANANPPIARFAISAAAVTIGQFEEFMQATGHVPMADRLENQPGYLLVNFRLNFGKSPKIPLFGVTYDDAVAYCEWAGLRLPTEPELDLFFVTMCALERKFGWTGECWSSTSDGEDHFLIRHGPYRKESLSDPAERYRKRFHRHQYEMLEAPCFRVARSLPDRGKNAVTLSCANG